VKLVDCDQQKLVVGSPVWLLSLSGKGRRPDQGQLERRARLKGWQIAEIKWVPGSGWGVEVSWGAPRPETAASRPLFFARPGEMRDTWRCPSLLLLTQPSSDYKSGEGNG